MQSQTTSDISRNDLKKEAYQLFCSAKRKLEKGDSKAAEECLLRAECLYSTLEAKKLLRLLQKNAKAKSDTENATSTQDKQQMNQNTKPSTSNSSETIFRQRTESHGSVKLNFTIEQLEAVRRVFKCQNHCYEILMIMPNASENEVKEAYKKLALLLHPDKNKAPGANAAFQILGKAKDVLSDPVKRKKYDVELEQERKNLYMANTSSKPSFDIPTWMVVGGATLIAAGLIGAWWSGRQKSQTQSSSDEEMSQDD